MEPGLLRDSFSFTYGHYYPVLEKKGRNCQQKRYLLKLVSWSRELGRIVRTHGVWSAVFCSHFAAGPSSGPNVITGL